MVTFLPAAAEAFMVQARRGLPSMRMVQQPHWPMGSQPFLGEMMSKSSRRRARSVRESAAGIVAGRLLRVN